MADELITVATFLTLPEALAARIHLESQGVHAVLIDAETVGMEWNVIGNIKLQVPTDQVEKVELLLDKVLARREQRANSAGPSDESLGPASEKSSQAPATPRADSLPKQTVPNGSLWLEVLAVLAVGVLPYLGSAVIWLGIPPRLLPYWVESLDICFRSLCVSYVVLYVMYRGDRAWTDYGLVRPRFSDLPSGFLVFLMGLGLWLFQGSLLSRVEMPSAAAFSLPRTWTDYVLMGVTNCANGFGEELVTRAYLITRLTQLTGSRSGAIALSSVLFASYHIYYGLAGLIHPMLLGLAFGVVFLITRRLWPLVLGHAFLNIFSELSLPR